MRPNTSPTLTSAPSVASIFCKTPAPFAPTSRFTLSVSSSTSTSPTLTKSPSFLSQRETVASSTDSPNSGTVISIAILASLLHHAGCLRLFVEIEGLLDQQLLIDTIKRCGALRRAGTLGSADIMQRHTVLQQQTQMRSQIIPGAHIQRFLLHPDQPFHIWIFGNNVFQLLLREGI